jgi:carnitine-CoA ligase
MIPRYFRFLDRLPRTPTEKVEKFRLRDAALSDTLDTTASPSAPTSART